jgi:hypothetical protein
MWIISGLPKSTQWEFILLYEVLHELRVKRKEGDNLESGI